MGPEHKHAYYKLLGVISKRRKIINSCWGPSLGSVLDSCTAHVCKLDGFPRRVSIHNQVLNESGLYQRHTLIKFPSATPNISVHTLKFFSAKWFDT